MHSHHIYPRHLGGSNNSGNLVEVSVEEHKRKIGLANKGQIPWNKGTKC